MALITCTECSKEISDKAATCPGCGAPVEVHAKQDDASTAKAEAAYGQMYSAPTNQDHSQQPDTKEKKQPKQYSLGSLIFLALVIWIGWEAVKLSESGSESRTVNTVETYILNSMDLDFSWGTSAGGNVMIADFIISNNGAKNVKDIEITCQHAAKSGTRIDRNKRTIYESIPANSKKEFSDFNMGFIHTQAEKSLCRITNLVVI